MTAPETQPGTAFFEAQGVTGAGFSPLSFSVEPGEMAFILTAKEETSLHLSRLFLGLERPREGRVLLFGNDPAALPVRDIFLLRQRIGLSQGLGGLVSNLKAWENLTLPLYYHRSLGHQEVEELGVPLLERLGYVGRYMELPGHLSLFQKKQIGMGRALITDPELVIYESPEQGVNQQEKELFFRLIREFHREREGRVSLILSCQAESVAEFGQARIFKLTKGQQA